MGNSRRYRQAAAQPSLTRSSVAALYLILALALTGALVFAIWLIGGEFLRLLALILVGGLMLALLTFASAFPVKAWRLPKTPPPVVEKHFIHTGTRTIERHTIDGRTVEAPRLFQLPAQSQAAAFPELLRAAYQSGTLANNHAAELPAEAEVRRLPARDGDSFSDWAADDSGWTGDINP